jgi:glycosyltransferase 2 family protein
MKRAMDVLWPVIGLGAVVLSSWLLFRELKGLSLDDVGAGLFRISPLHWALAVASAALAYAALAWYDQIALMHLGHKLSWRFVALVSFTTYALAHNIGASVFSGAVVRYRAYSTKGLSAGEIGLLVAFCSVTFTLGSMLLGGLVLVIEPEFVSRMGGAPVASGRIAALVLLLAPWAYTVGSLLHFRPVRLFGFELVYPRPPIAARQLLAGPVELIGAAGIIYFALPAEHNPGYLIVLAGFLASFSLALISHAPGGLGVLEFTFLKLLPDAPKADVIVALIVFRLLYLIIPLIFALVVVVLFERERLGALLKPTNWRQP